MATERSLGWELTPASMAAQCVRSELYLFTTVVDVLPGARPDSVVIVHSGPARPEASRAELREATPRATTSCAARSVAAA